MPKKDSRSVETRGDEILIKAGNYMVHRPRDEYMSETITRCTVKSCRLMHGAISWAASLVTGVLSLGLRPPLEHWWVILKSDRAFYCVQIWADNVIKIDRGNEEDMDYNGKRAVKQHNGGD